MASIPAAGYISDPTRTKGQLKTSLEALVASLRHVPWSGQVELAYTIVSGSITPAGAGGVLVVDTEAAAATDDLTNIVTTNYPEGAFVLLRNANAARTVVVKHAITGIGTMQLDRGVDYALDDTKKWLLLRRHGTDWYELLRGPQRLVSEVSVKSATFTVQKQDIGKIFVCSGTYTVSLAAAAGMGNGFIVGIRNVGTGTLTIDPNSSELIDGATVASLPPGWSIQLVCTGTAWTTVASTGPSVQRNPFTNGMMEVWQRGTTFPYTIGNGAQPTADRWLVLGAGATKSFTMNRSTNVPTVAQAGVLFNYSLELDVTTALGSPASGDALSIYQVIEAGTWRHFAQRQLTISFWVMSSKTGTHTLRLRASNLIYFCILPYTINAADTWEYKTLTVSASIAWGQNSFEAHWVVLAGSGTIDTTINTWHQVITGPANLAAPGQVNCFDSTANFFRLTGVKIELGSIATPYDVTSFTEEYLRCLGHYQKSFPYATAPVQNAGSNTGEFIFRCPVGGGSSFANVPVTLPVPMPLSHVVLLYNPDVANFQIRDRSAGVDCDLSNVTSIGPHGFVFTADTSSSSAIGNTMAIHWVARTNL